MVFLTVLIIIAALLLIIAVLLQNGKGEGLASNFVAGNQTFGVRGTADILEKATWGLVAIILVLSIATSFISTSTGNTIDISNKIENVNNNAQPEFPAALPQEAPAQETPATPAE